MIHYLKKTTILICLTILLWGNVFALPAKTNMSTKSHDPSIFIMNYFQNPDSDRLIPTLKKILSSDIPWQPNLSHFYAAAIRNSKNKRSLLKELAHLKSQYTTKNQKKLIHEITNEIKNFHSPQANSSKNFDLLWAEFFATGREKPIKKIASYLNLKTAQPKIKVIYLASAEWSLASNANEFPKVAAILKNIYASSKGIMKRRLKRILDNPADIADRFEQNNLVHEAPDFETFKNIIW